MRDERSLGWGCVAFLVGMAIIIRADFGHYTWWMVTEFWALALLACFDLDHLFAVTFLSQSILVILGVAGMSLMECAMLRETAAELGLGYVPLNFLVHYAPSIVVLASPPRRPITNYTDQIVTGAAVFVAYALINNAVSVYGCTFRRGVAPLVFTLVSFSATHPAIERFWLSALTPEAAR